MVAWLAWLYSAGVLVVGLPGRTLTAGYALAAAGEAALWGAAFELASLRPLVAVLAVGYAAFLALDVQVLRGLGAPIESHLVAFAARERENVFILFRRSSGVAGHLVFAGLSGCAVVSACAGGAGWPLRLVGGVVAAALVVLARMTTLHGSLPPVPNLVRSIAIFLRRRVRGGRLVGLGSARREAVAASTLPPPRFDVLVIVVESLSRSILESPAGMAATPRLQRFRREMQGRLVEFRIATSNSTASEVSYPSLLTGLSPERSHADFHRAPLLWHVAKARGYQTAFYSAHSLRWSNLDLFLIDDSLDRAVYRETLGAPAANDLGMDDLELQRILLDELGGKGPRFTVWIPNMLHVPGLAQGGSPGQRYLASLSVFDGCFGELLDRLDLERTAIFLTGDHAELPGQPGLRLSDMNDELVSVPFLVALPPGLSLAARPDAPVAGIDLFPTVVELIGVDPETLPVPLSGNSLFGPLPDGRTLISLNTCSLRDWGRSPFLVRFGDERVYFHDDGTTPDFGGHLDDLLEIPEIGAILARRGVVPGVVYAPGSVVGEYARLAELGPDAELHKLDNWGLFERKDFVDMCRRTVEWIGIADGERVFECGCGAGAFLDVVKSCRQVTVGGVDRSPAMIDIARRRVSGDFRAGDMTDLHDIATGSVDVACAHAVFTYFATEAAIERAVDEMVRIVRPGGRVYAGVINDPARRAAAAKKDGPSGNWIVGPDFWRAYAARRGLAIRVANQSDIYRKASGHDGHSRVRYSVLVQKSEPSPNATGEATF